MAQEENLSTATGRRTRCLESNDYRCQVCGEQFDRMELFTQPYDNSCYCKACWLSGEYKKYR